MRPSLSYLDKADIGVHKTEAAANAGGDTTESEGEDAKLVTVRFANPEGMGKSQKKVGHKMSFTEMKKSLQSAQEWNKAEFFGEDSEEASEERQLLFANTTDRHKTTFDLKEEQYMNVMFPREVGRSENSGGANGAPSGVVSLQQIKKYPLKRQVSLTGYTCNTIFKKTTDTFTACVSASCAKLKLYLSALSSNMPFVVLYVCTYTLVPLYVHVFHRYWKYCVLLT